MEGRGRTVCVIQARMGSTRLPGKVMMDIGGDIMLSRTVRRAARASGLDAVVVATTTHARDDVIEDTCRKRGWAVTRGREDDVLDRYVQAARAFEAAVVVRVTSDCPLIDPGILDALINEYRRLQPGTDYVSNFMPERTFPRGLEAEAVRIGALETAWHEDDNPAWREHVTPYVNRQPDRFPAACVTWSEDHSHHRWTVDTPEDLALVRRIYDHFGHDGFTWLEVLELLECHPEWVALNRDIRQMDI